MRYILSLALLLSACTRANPDAIGGGGGSGGGAAGSGGGGGGSAGGGGTGGGVDLAMSLPHDMATSPADMTSFEGVFCGNMTCLKPTEECCVTQATGTLCQSPAVQCVGRAFDCDGPEDCTAPDECCGSINGSSCNSGGGGCSNNEVPLCHTLPDCGGHGYVACCGASNGGHLRFCSKNPCP